MLLSSSRLNLRIAALTVLAASVLASSPLVAAGRKQVAEEPPEETFNGKAMLAVVSIGRQRVSLYDADGGVLRSSVSSGQSGYETPPGVYSILQKKEEHFSNLYDDASMPFMQRITWSGVALHAGVVPGYPASHGCVRLPSHFAERIFPTTHVGMRIVLSREDVVPVPVSHPFLFQPRPALAADLKATRAAYWREDEDTTPLPDVAAWPARLRLQQHLQAVTAEKSRAARNAADAAEPAKEVLKEKSAELVKSERAIKSAEAAVRRAKDGIAQAEKVAAKMRKPSAIEAANRMKEKAAAALAKAESQLASAQAAAKATGEVLARATETAKGAQDIEDKAQAEFKDAERKMLPVSVFISAKTQRLYVRQNREPVFDMPVAIRDPERSLGTHVFTALSYGEDGDSVRWNVVSTTHRAAAGDEDGDDDEGGGRRGKRHNNDGRPPLTDVAAAQAALDRISIPDDIRARLAEHVWPGSSIIVSDEELSKETGKATEFVVVMSGEPAGALKKRPKPSPDRGFDRYYDPYGYQASASPYYGSPYGSSRYRQYYRPSPKPSIFGFW